MDLYEELLKDYRFREGMHTCINCGTCTAICPAAEFYKYDPRKIMDTIQRRDPSALEELLRSDTIWYCGECFSCVTRCPRKNGPGLVIMALRNLSIRLGYFMDSERGRQMYPLSKSLGENILKYGYCIHPDSFKIEEHPESGPVWKWVLDNRQDVYDRAGANYMKPGPGALRKIAPEDLQELKAIFDVTGGTARMELIERLSLEKAEKMGMSPQEYRKWASTLCSDKHFND